MTPPTRAQLQEAQDALVRIFGLNADRVVSVTVECSELAVKEVIAQHSVPEVGTGTLRVVADAVATTTWSVSERFQARS